MASERKRMECRLWVDERLGEDGQKRRYVSASLWLHGEEHWMDLSGYLVDALGQKKPVVQLTRQNTGLDRATNCELLLALYKDGCRNYGGPQQIEQSEWVEFDVDVTEGGATIIACEILEEDAARVAASESSKAPNPNDRPTS